MRKILLAVCVLALALGACSISGSARDLEGIQPFNPAPGSVKFWNHLDGHPNIARVCLDGVAFWTTTRDYGDAVGRVPEWDDECTQYVGQDVQVQKGQDK